ncbi:hypothetical protein EST38_g2433 [Candolleomyces aberdarensis]|uniref:Protein kinase domain-containing protein n=1 Tax=Candolleomyces aberdarensis TaxID=2316362 RepID=A0A4Q2DUJ2_9AGAR|nr:hypothetical protein EST38_g2433 [Candolleomyces aberdarensis]
MTSFSLQLAPYFSRVFWKFWFSSCPLKDDKRRLHVYNVYDNQLDEIHEAPTDGSAPLFQGFYPDSPKDRETTRILNHANDIFTYLEEDVSEYLKILLKQLSVSSSAGPAADNNTHPTTFTADLQPSTVSLTVNQLAKLRRFLVFIRFRNSAGYASLVRKLFADLEYREEDGNIYPAYRSIIVQMQRRYVLQGFTDFLQGHGRRLDRVHDEADRPLASAEPTDKFIEFFHEIMDAYCWRLLDAEVCVGVVADERETGREEFIISDACYGSLDEGFGEDPESCDFFFPINPSVSIYLLGTSTVTPPPPLLNPHTLTRIPIGSESMIDVHLRNSMILQTYPHRLIFSSLKCIVCSLKSYDEFRWINEHQDYSRLRMRCRQKYSKEEVVKTLVIRDHGKLFELDSNYSDGDTSDDDEQSSSNTSGSLQRRHSGSSRKAVRVFDLTEQVRLEGTWAVGFGTFSDVWKAMWQDPMENRERTVAVKFLRSVMVQNVKERLIRRIQTEVSTWHKLCHRNVSQFFGIVQSECSFGMVSPWYSNGIICDYLKTRPNADRLKLLTQIASGVCHLHSHTPPIVHGDLKGGNILIDAHGYAIITDFGLSKVMEEVSQACSSNSPPGTACGGRGTSVFAGSTRWMAPELILALVDEDEHNTDSAQSPGGSSSSKPKITTKSDVYAFASVCLEVCVHLTSPALPNGLVRNENRVD